MSLPEIPNAPWAGMSEAVMAVESIPAILDFMIHALRVMVQGRVSQKEAEDYRAMVRSTDGKILSIMGANYKIHQPRDMWNNIFLPYIMTGQLQVKRAGLLGGGTIMWIQADVPGMYYDTKRGRMELSMLLASSFDGSIRTYAIPTSIDVVCLNTLLAAIRQGGKSGFSQKHTSELRVADAAAEVAQAISGFRIEGEQVQRMGSVKVNSDIIRAYVAELVQPELVTLNLPDRGNQYAGKTVRQLLDFSADAVIVERNFHEHAKTSANKILDVIPRQKGGFDGSLHGLVSAVTYWNDYERGRSQDARLTSSWFGPNADFKRKAFNLANNYAEILAA